MKEAKRTSISHRSQCESQKLQESQAPSASNEIISIPPMDDEKDDRETSTHQPWQQEPTKTKLYKTKRSQAYPAKGHTLLNSPAQSSWTSTQAAEKQQLQMFGGRKLETPGFERRLKTKQEKQRFS
ncbi:hypothetical protein CAEBREN_00232 [Caenorhabditis brenneri]|uniref:Uncharacterized protein n=1 Tax=Caenorhabditis brenneri TaxID=135651 RepID=G0PJ41_CAEBE|nr:hypothetical protein CAEBREN_00232 [Caenorhabditis brenneri]